MVEPGEGPNTCDETAAGREAGWMAFRTVAWYVIAGALWISLSDSIAAQFAARSPDTLNAVQSLKGVGYVVVTATMLWFLMRRQIAAVLRSREQVRRSEREVVERLARAAEWRDDDTAQHIQRVGEISYLIARQAGLEDELCGIIRDASSMHDLGKIGVPDAVLRKPGKLSPEEFELVKQHPNIGADILQGGTTPLVQMAEVIARWHHERWDGTGYPDGLQGEEIPIPARIVAIADVFDALTSRRPYKEAWPMVRAIQAIRSLAGTHFDPRLVECFLNALPEIAEVMQRLSDAPASAEIGPAAQLASAS